MSKKNDFGGFKVDYIPEILYEAPTRKETQVSPIPYIEVPLGKKMPKALYIFEYQETAETEPDERGREVPVWDQIPHIYLDLESLAEVIKKTIPGKTGLKVYDDVRVSLGMKPISEAKKLGQELMDKVKANIETKKVDIISSQGERKKQYEETRKETLEYLMKQEKGEN